MSNSLLERASDCLRCDLRDVQVSPHRQPAQMPNLAFARRNQITLSTAFEQLTPASQSTIVAHELAHVAQKRRGTRGLPKSLIRHPAYRHLLEFDAAIATAEIFAGQVVHTLLPDDPEEVSPWGPAGHYWTSLAVMLAAGMEHGTALRRAFYCQVPDQVLEFDATAAFVDYIQESDPQRMPELGLPATPPEQIEHETVQVVPSYSVEVPNTGVYYTIYPGISYESPLESAASRDRRRMLDRDISSGLHCLTGRRGSDEVAFRAANSISYANNEVAFGVSLHCFGDSYAHQTFFHYMFPAIIGHGLSGHTPDKLAEHKTQYFAYIIALYNLITKCFGGSFQGLPKLLRGLAAIANMEFSGDDNAVNAAQSAEIRDYCISSGLAPRQYLNYFPEYEPASYWKDFSRRNKDRIRPYDPALVFKLIRALGKAWNTNK